MDDIGKQFKFEIDDGYIDGLMKRIQIMMKSRLLKLKTKQQSKRIKNRILLFDKYRQKLSSLMNLDSFLLMKMKDVIFTQTDMMKVWYIKPT